MGNHFYKAVVKFDDASTNLFLISIKYYSEAYWRNVGLF